MKTAKPTKSRRRKGCMLRPSAANGSSRFSRLLRAELLEDRRMLAVTLDASFGDGGIVTTNLAYEPSNDQADDVIAVQADGKIIAAGLGGYGDFALARYNTDGSLDTNFDGDGKVTIDFTGSGDRAYGVALDANGRIIIVGASYQGSSGSDFAVARLNADGSLDTTFDGDGKVTIDFVGSDDYAYGVAVDANGKIVLGGYSYQGSSGSDFAAARLNVDGSLDTTFDGDGKVAIDFAGSYDYAFDVAVGANGKIVFAGRSYQGVSRYDFAAARLNADGSLDGGFGADGTATVDLGGSDDYAYGVAVDADGKIVLGGYSTQGITGNDFAAVRFLSDGSLDPTFGTLGKITTDFSGSSDRAYDVAIAPNGKIILAGAAHQGYPTYDNFALARYHSNGGLDASFGGDGKVTTNVLGHPDQAQGVDIDADGNIVVAGWGYNISSDTYDWVLARYVSSGNLDSAFGGDGIVYTGFQRETSEYVEDLIALQPDGKIVVLTRVSSTSEFALLRYNVDGNLDTSFGTDGIATHDFDGRGQYADALVADGTGKLIVAGRSNQGSGYDFAVARLNSDGSLDTTFDGDGNASIDFAGSHDYAYGVAVDADGKIVLAGYSRQGGSNDFAAARLNADGSLDTSFGADGKVTVDFAGSHDYAYDVVIGANGKIVLAGRSHQGSGYDFAVARLNADGSLDTSLDGDGKVTTDIGGSDDYLEGVAIDDSGKIIVAGTARFASSSDFALARYNTDGSLDVGFGGDGTVTTDFGGNANWAYDIQIDGSGRYVVGGETETPDSWDFALARYNSDGTLDTTFDSDGLLTTDLGMLYDGIWRIAIDGAGRIIAGGWTANDIALARYTTNQPPTVNDASYELAENSAAGTLVGSVLATDPDNDTLTYSLLGGTGAVAFDVDADTGEITVLDAAPLDFETTTSFTLDVEVDDGNGCTDTATITINLLNQASISGDVFVDINENGLREANEPGIDGVVVELRDQDGSAVLNIHGQAITAVTANGGFYLFEDLDPGDYQLHEVQPTGVDDGAELLGSLGGAVVADDVMQLTLQRTDAFDYVFAEIGQQVASGDTATIGFWQNKHGQALIAAGGSDLATWLTSNLSNVFGDSLVDATGQDVADFYRDQLFKQKAQKSAGPAKVDAQFMAVALATYFTSSNLAGAVASGYGLNVSDTGIGTKVVNVGTCGDAFNVADGVDLTIMQLLLATDSLTDLPDGISGFAHIYDTNGDGVIDAAEAALRVMANELYSSINEEGDS